MTAAKKDILQGWKDIAAYVSRDVRTVKRWEKQRGLPVRRMPGDGRANVYALIPELDSWLSSTASTEIEPQEESALADAFQGSEPGPHPLPLILDPPIDPQSSPAASLAQRRWISATVITLVAAAAIAAVAVGVRTHRREQAATIDIPPFNPTQTVQMVKYSSKQPGVDALYLRGIYFYEQRPPDTLDRALRCFQQAIARDPGYAPAYAGLAQTYNLEREFSMMPDTVAYGKAGAAAQRAIALDPNLPEAHAALGFVKFFGDWDAPAAEREFRTAIALDPSSALAHHWYGSMLTHQGRFNDSLAQLDLAQRLQPTSTSILCDRAFVLGVSGRRNEAADILQEVVNEDPNSPESHYVLAVISLVDPPDLPRYLDEFRRFATLRHDSHELNLLDTLEPAFRSGGDHALWTALLAEEQQAHPSPNDRTYPMAQAETLLGRPDDAFRDLAQLAARRDPSMMGIEVDPLLASIRHDPRFASIAASIGLPSPF